jgi:hypothetical protein
MVRSVCPSVGRRPATTIAALWPRVARVAAVLAAPIAGVTAVVSTSFAACLVAGVFCGTAAAQNVANAEVYVVATELADEVELIREAMGRPYDDSPRLPAAGVTLFELYFQAETLLRKSNQLAIDLAGAPSVERPRVPAGTIAAADILPLVERALFEIRRVRAELGITEPVVRVTREAAIAPTGVFSVILDTNRQLDLLLAAPIESRDVYAGISAAIDNVAAILAARGIDATSLGALSAAEVVPRRPADVYARLLECVDVVAAIAPRLGVEVVSLSSRRNIPDDIAPGHVYDVAEILVADTLLFARTVGVAGTDQPRTVVAPKHVFPAHTYARAAVLQAQLERLAASLRQAE